MSLQAMFACIAAIQGGETPQVASQVCMASGEEMVVSLKNSGLKPNPANEEIREAAIANGAPEYVATILTWIGPGVELDDPEELLTEEQFQELSMLQALTALVTENEQ